VEQSPESPAADRLSQLKEVCGSGTELRSNQKVQEAYLGGKRMEREKNTERRMDP
jgi:hypothetical protein